MKDEGKYGRINDILAKYGIKPFSENSSQEEPVAEEKGEVGIKAPTPSEPTKEEEPSQVVEETSVITLVEDDVESGEMFNRQQQYEAELMNLPPDHPKNLFPHNYLRANYLPVVTMKSKSVKSAKPEDVAEELKSEAYAITKQGTPKIKHAKFCRIWHQRFGYEECNGLILTPQGAISVDSFRKEITSMLMLMATEEFNIDYTASHLLHTYMDAYYTKLYLNKNKIPFRNGDLIINADKKSFTFYEGCLSPVPYRFDYDFKNIKNTDEPPFPNFKEWRDGLFEEGDQYTLKQLLGYLLIPSNSAQEAFFIIGKGGSGKSILTDCIIPKMLGNASFRMSLSTFFADKFQLGLSEGKLCMVDDDIGEANLSKADSGRFKNFVTADVIQIEKKFCTATEAINCARIVCSGNHMINSSDKSDGFTRRLHPIYTKPREIENVDRNFKFKIEREISMIVLWALEGLLELLGNGGIPYKSERTLNRLSHYEEEQKWEEQFVTDCFECKDGTVSYSQDVRAALEEWIKDNMEMCGEGSIDSKFRAVTRWLQDEGADKYGYIYKRGIRRGNAYNARGYINMALKAPVTDPDVFLDELGNYKIRTKKRKPEDQVDLNDEV